MVERKRHAESGRKVDQLASHIGRQCLPAFIVTNVSLRAADAFGHRLLGNSEQLSDGLEVVHAPIVAALGINVNIAAILRTQQRR